MPDFYNIERGVNDRATENRGLGQMILVAQAGPPKPAQPQIPASISLTRVEANPVISNKKISFLIRELKKIFLLEFGKYMPPESQKKVPTFAVIPNKDMAAITRAILRRDAESILKSLQEFNPYFLRSFLRAALYYPNQVPYDIDMKTQFNPRDKEILINHIMRGGETPPGIVQVATTDRKSKIYFNDFFMSEDQFNYAIEIPASIIAHELAHVFSHRYWHLLFRIVLHEEGGAVLDEGMTEYRVAKLIFDKWSLKQSPKVANPKIGYTHDPHYQSYSDTFVAQVGVDAAFEAYFGGWVEWDDIDHPENALVIGIRNTKAMLARKQHTVWKWPGLPSTFLKP